MDKKFWFRFGGNQAKAIGETLRGIDPDNKGEDDVIGTVFQSAGIALVAYSSGNLSGFKSYLKAAADGIYNYLGLELPSANTE